MANTLKQTAMAYEGEARIKNIAELTEVSTDINVERKVVKDRDGKELFNVDIVKVDGVEYRVPKTVLKSLKVFLEDNPNLKTFKVRRTGTTKEDTVYTVIPMKYS